MTEFCVYEVWDLQRDEPIYVGKARSVEDRVVQHHKYMKKVRNGPAFHKILRKMLQEGTPHEFRPVFKTSNEDEAFAEEKRRIALHGRRDQSTGSLWNLTDGGEGVSGWSPPPEVRKHWSEQRKGRQPSNKGRTYTHSVVSPKRGKPWTEKQRTEFEARTPEQRALSRQRMSEAHKGHVWTPEARAKLSTAMAGSNNPMFGRPGAWTGKTGPWAGKTHPNKGRKKGPDGKLYYPDELQTKFGRSDS